MTGMAHGVPLQAPKTSVRRTRGRSFRIRASQWAELVKEANTEDAIKRLYSHDRVITLDEMPGWDN